MPGGKICQPSPAGGSPGHSSFCYTRAKPILKLDGYDTEGNKKNRFALEDAEFYVIPYWKCS